MITLLFSIIAYGLSALLVLFFAYFVLAFIGYLAIEVIKLILPARKQR